MSRSWLILLVLLLVVRLGAPAVAQTAHHDSAGTSTRIGKAHPISAAPRIDGRLDEAQWREAPLLDGFLQRELHEGDPVSERTEVRLLTDGEALYVGAWLFDRDVAGIVNGEKVRDVTLTNGDAFAIILDTYHDRQNGFVFATTPAGVEYDGQVAKEGEGGGVFQANQTRAQAGAMGGFNLNWDGSWTVATSRDSLGWYAEFRIPFSTLRYGAGATQLWGLNFSRSIRRKGEEALWSFVPRQFSLYRLSRAGVLEGIRVPVRRVATITPYALAGTQRNYLVESRFRQPAELGADAKYGVTPSLTLDLTYNTDFAQVEVDEVRSNLTRFPLFFPEKRPFFLENAGVFSAGTPQAVDLFFTRRIGIDSLGNPVPIIGGGRLTGRVGEMTVGALQLFTDRAGAQARMSYSVGRVSREIGRRGRIGVIGIQRRALDDAANHNRTFGVDGRIGLGDAWTIDWWGAGTRTPASTGNEAAFSARAGFQTGNYNHSLRYVQVGESFNPEVGFLNRSGGYRFYELALMRLVRHRAWPWLKQWNPHANIQGYVGLDGFFQSGRFHVDVTEVELANGGRFGPDFNVYREGLQRPFRISPNVVLPAGTYTYTLPGVDYQSDPSKPLSVVLRLDAGQFYTGTRAGATTTFTVRHGTSLTSSLLVDYNDVRLDEGSFTRSLVGLRLNYYFTPRIFAASLLQYSDQAGAFASNARFGWLSTAGTGLFIVVNEGRQASGLFDWVRPQSRSLVVKYTRQFGTGG